ncbi:MAG: aminotransferase class I/II-fold pyridoxal phosphate-dependent enzyme [Saprospirales bacterium]|nr:aminotransferase class I/II-fold pyridoxal phosphate-dependent enzyme [Saprospirales bacterium]
MDTRIERIKALEVVSKRLEPDGVQRADWNQKVQAYADQFIDKLPDAKGYVWPEKVRDWPQDCPIGETPRELDELLQILEREVDEVGLNPASGAHLAYIPGGGVFPTALGDYLAAVTNRYSGLYFANPGAVQLENQVIRWMCDMVGYPADALGNLASGGSIANLIAITTARDHMGIKSRVVESAVIYLTAQVHHCVHKAIRIAGLGEAIVRTVPMDKRFRMDANALRAQVESDKAAGLKPFLVVASAGTTDTGAMDPLDAVADIAEANDLWFHVDAAYGGFFMLLDDLKPTFSGIERSDSIAIDPHKGLFLSYGLGAVLIKNVRALYESHYYRANYMQDAQALVDEPSPADLSPELTKHFRGLRLWMALQLYGLAPFRACLDEKRWLARYFYEEIQKLGFEVGPYPDLSVMIYRYLPASGDPNAFNSQLMELLHRDGRIFVSSTTIDGVFWIRLAVLSFRTHLSHIERLLAMIRESVEVLDKIWLQGA